MTRPMLHDYSRSSAAYRVRIALNLKGVEYDRHPVNLLEGDQKADEYRALNPQGLVPMLEIDGLKLTQSLAIMVYLDQRYPEPPLMPADPADGAHVRAMALAIACDIHPLNNLRVLKYLAGPLRLGEDERSAWYAHWITEGFTALEAHGRAPRRRVHVRRQRRRIADICLVPQMFNARRFNVPVDAYPTLLRADASANRLEAFAAAHPDRQEAPRMNRVDDINRGMAGMKAAANRSRSRASRARSATRNGRSGSISPPPTGWSRITAGTTSSSPICRRGFPGPSTISCSIRTI